VQALLGEELDEDVPLEEVVAAAAEKFHLFFLIPDLQRRGRCEARWRELLGDHVVCMETPADTCAVAAALVGLTEGRLADANAVAQALEADGMDRNRIGAVVRAVRPYAGLLNPGQATMPSAAGGGSTATPRWWQRLFKR
jgi:hypothetical protein